MRLPLIGSVIALGWGIGLIVGYGHVTTGFNAAYPFAGSMLHFDITTTGAGVLGGAALIALGILLLIWAFFAALASIFTRGRRREVEVVEHYPVVTRHENEAQPAETRHFWTRPSARAHHL